MKAKAEFLIFFIFDIGWSLWAYNLYFQLIYLNKVLLQCVLIFRRLLVPNGWYTQDQMLPI